MKVYGIGGLGVDERVFAELNLDFELTPLKWIEPKSKEPIQQYAARFAEQIDQRHPFAIVGISFGGLMAIELNKILNVEKIVLISSATSKSDIPRVFRFFGKSGLLSLIPNFLMKPPFFFGKLPLWSVGTQIQTGTEKNSGRYRHSLPSMGYRRNCKMG